MFPLPKFVIMLFIYLSNSSVAFHFYLSKKYVEAVTLLLEYNVCVLVVICPTELNHSRLFDYMLQRPAIHPVCAFLEKIRRKRPGSSSSAPPCRERERASWRPPPHLTTPTPQALSQRPHLPTPSERGHGATGSHSRREDRSGIPALFRPSIRALML